MRLELDPSNPEAIELLDRLDLVLFTVDAGERIAGSARPTELGQAILRMEFERLGENRPAPAVRCAL